MTDNPQDNVSVSRERLRNMADALKFFASEMTVGQRYTDYGQTALDAPGEIRKLLEEAAARVDEWGLDDTDPYIAVSIRRMKS